MATITVTGTYTDGAGTPLNGVISFTPVVTGTDGTSVFIADPINAQVTGGALSQVLTTTDSWSVEGAVTYKVVERVGSTGRNRYYVTLPSSLGTSVNLSTRLQFKSPPNQVQLESGGDTTDFTSHVATLHAPIDAELVSLDARLDAVEAGSGTGAHNSLTSRTAADGHPTSAITGLDAALAGKQPLDADLTAIAALNSANDSIMQRKAGAWTGSTPAQVATDMGVASDSTQTLTNKTLDFDFDTTGNVISNIPYTSIPGLEADLGSISQPGFRYVVYDGANYPARSTSGTIDPNEPIIWVRGPGPTLSGTGSTGAVVGDYWLRTV